MKDINGVAYGQMLLQLPEDDTAVNRIKAYLDKKDVKYEEV
jgi:D-methionine transport system ATP-binding protein